MNEQEKEYVGMANCYFCNKPKEILLDKRLKKTLPREAVYDMEPCNECKDWMKKGVILISVRDGEKGNNPYKTGGWVVITEDEAKRMFGKTHKILTTRFAFVEDKSWDRLGIPRGKIK